MDSVRPYESLEFVSGHKNLCFYWEFIGSNSKSLSCNFCRDISKFEDNTSRFYRSSIHFDASLSSSHWDFECFLCVRFVRKNTNPKLSTLLKKPNDCLSSTFDLSRSNITSFCGLKCVFTKRHCSSTLSESFDDTSVGLAIFGSTRL